MGEQKYVCEICGRKCCSFGGMKLHKNSCVRLEENKLDIINEYKDVGSVQKVARTRHINIPDLSERLKIWGVKLKYQDSDRYYHKGVRYSFDEDYFNVLGDRQYWMLGMFASDGNIKGNHIFNIM